MDSLQNLQCKYLHDASLHEWVNIPLIKWEGMDLKLNIINIGSGRGSWLLDL